MPSGPKARIEANLQAIRLLREIEKEERNATEAEKAILAKYSFCRHKCPTMPMKQEIAEEHRSLDGKPSAGHKRQRGIIVETDGRILTSILTFEFSDASKRWNP